MIRTLATAAIALSIGLGTLATGASRASADDLRITIGGGDYRYDRDDYRDDRGGYRRHRDRDDRREHRADREWDRPSRASCSPRRALDKAWRLGINRPYVSSVRRNVINVGGFQRGHNVRVTFARAPNCPLIR